MDKNIRNNQIDNLQPRPPIVVILGHVDHGKTSILDYIRKTKIAEKESGGITQHIGAYQIILPPEKASSSQGQPAEGSRGETTEFLRSAQDDKKSRKITFIDTPGHEAFSAMRSRGAKVADIAVLVVAAEEGVKPQTKEAINLISRQELPVIVAINKMDKPGALPDKVKKELAENNLLVESLGGKIPVVLVSAKTGLNIDGLLEMILLIAEMEEIKTDYSKPACGIIIESKLDPQRGATATLLVRDGILDKKDVVAAESAFGCIRSMENFLGQPIEQAPAATPVLITGLNAVPPVGEEWQVLPSLEEARIKTEAKAQAERKKREPAGGILEISPDQKIFNLILKADVSGSLEAIREALKSIPQDEIILRVVRAEVGDITENDIKLAESAKAKTYGFRVKAKPEINLLAERRGVRLFVSQIIYELIQTVREDASRLLKPELNREKIGRIKIIALFKEEGKRQIIGGRVTVGKIERGLAADVIRNEEIIGSGRIAQLQVNKESAPECGKDRECGMMFEGEVKVEKNDILEAYREEKVKREL